MSGERQGVGPQAGLHHDHRRVARAPWTLDKLQDATMGADAGETRSVAVGMVFIATSGVLVSIMSTFTWIVTDARISTMQIVCRHRALHQTRNSVLRSR